MGSHNGRLQISVEDDGAAMAVFHREESELVRTLESDELAPPAADERPHKGGSAASLAPRDHAEPAAGSGVGQNDVFPWNALPKDMMLRIFQSMSLLELMDLRSRFIDDALKEEVKRRISALYPLYEAWIDAPLEHRNLKNYRERAFRVKCTPREFVQLKRVVLGGCLLSSLPGAIGDMRELQVLYLDENRLSALPDELALCKKLRVVDLMTNLLVKFPRVLLRLPNIYFLSVSFNKKLEELPEEIGDCFPNLQGFGAFGCHLERLPVSLLRRADANDKAFMNVQYNRFTFAYIQDVVRQYPSLRRKLAIV
ncbi:Plant intracellular Ras-group-related LRR protein 7 [Porphyridium purpureum]|uniref:Plant intracellular Ras-group-related LRR protein 7 n=1 Tax=Porphyridium purpureum TaxID=35688 RepID=A0A5J4YR87_PORPP|nr:Plant intracellular Ras-group-related LRR protein 7 [Porphyridium purpureum]|eukprot:POR9420..scf236_6